MLMTENEDKASAMAVLEQIREGKINEDMCKEIRRYPVIFDKVGIHSIDIMAMLKMKAKLTFFPDSMSYSIQDPRRVNHIYTNFDNPEMGLADENEKRFAEALSFYYSMKEEYKCRLDNFVRGINDKYYDEIKGIGDCIEKDDAKDFLAEVLFDRRIPEITGSNFKHYQMMFDKYDLHHVYNMADNKVLLQWKAAFAAESEGFLDKGVAEVLLWLKFLSYDPFPDRIQRNRYGHIKRLWTERNDTELACRFLLKYPEPGLVLMVYQDGMCISPSRQVSPLPIHFLCRRIRAS